jgi:hypothetical protein
MWTGLGRDEIKWDGVFRANIVKIDGYVSGAGFVWNDGNGNLVLGTAAGGGASPLTTKGDIYTFSTIDARLAVGSNGQVLVADSSSSTGIKWSGGQVTAATFDITASGAIVSAVADQKVKVYGISMHNNDATGSNDEVVRIQSNTNGTDLYGGTTGGVYLQGAGGYFGLPVNAMTSYFETTAGHSLYLNLKNGKRVSGIVWYKQEA